MEKTQATKERLDLLLLEQGYFESREKAKAAIMAGLVLVGTERVDKAGTKIPRDAAITVKGSVHPYVSRGGLKLEKAIKHFGLNLQDAVMLDIGASTGGFTDCALQNGAARVYAVDVGYNQLDWSLRQDSRVQVLERTNFRHMTGDQLDGPLPLFATIDVSFISLRLILPVLAELLQKKRTHRCADQAAVRSGAGACGQVGRHSRPGRSYASASRRFERGSRHRF